MLNSLSRIVSVLSNSLRQYYFNYMTSKTGIFLQTILFALTSNWRLISLVVFAYEFPRADFTIAVSPVVTASSKHR